MSIAVEGEPSRNTEGKGRLSTDQKADNRYYAGKKGLYQEYLGDLYYDTDPVDHLNSRNEINAYIHCVSIMEDYSPQYHYSRVSAPHDKTKRANKFTRTISKCESEQAVADEIAYMHQMAPLTSQTKSIYDDAVAEVKQVLIDAKVGQERMRVLVPLLVQVLELHKPDQFSPQFTQFLKRISTK